jgi:glycosyltransferase involved in cell wall biosynthesis
MLQNTLKSFLHLDYPNFEVVVVNGPSTDNTAEILLQWSEKIKIGDCPDKNLSKSRNIGIAMASGEFVAFIDDDAIPEPEWLSQAIEAFDDDEIAGVGGKVYNNTGYDFQCEYVNVNRLGNAKEGMKKPSPEYCFPGSFEFPHLLGTNSIFRRKTLLEIGGFDEMYAYYLDETDVCLRLIDSGYVIRQLPKSFVHHKFAPSDIRTKTAYTSRYNILKSKVYFANAHSHYYLSSAETDMDIQIFFQLHRGDVMNSIKLGNLQDDSIKQFEHDAIRALKEGQDGVQIPPKLISENLLRKWQSSFKKFNTIVPEQKLTIVFLSSDYPPQLSGGIARYTKDIASSVASLGHQIHVITSSQDNNTVDFEDGVWVHRIKILHQHLTEEAKKLKIHQAIWDISQTFYMELERILSHREIDLIEAPIWDVIGLSAILSKKYKVVTTLETTLKLSLDSRPDLTSDSDTMRDFVEPLIALEKYVLQNSDALIGISNGIVTEIEESYELELSSGKKCIIPLGMPDWSIGINSRGQLQKNNKTVSILFVGRLEKRKGIDILLSCIPELCEKFDNIKFDIVGDDSIVMEENATYRKMFESRHSALCGSRVFFHGKVDDDALKRHYASCDIFVAPSRFESFGLIYLEAMMFSKPVIGCDIGGIPEVVKSGETGLLALPGDKASLYASLMSLIENSEFRNSLGKNGRQRYEEFFSDVRMAKSSVDFYKKIVDITPTLP